MPPKKAKPFPSDKPVVAASDKTPPPLWCIAIGASAGGLEALRPLISALRPGGHCCYLLAQHMSLHGRSLLRGMLQEHAQIRVESAVDGQRLLADHLYIAPQGHHLRVQDAHIRLDLAGQEAGPVPRIDHLFCSVAAGAGAQAVAVILSGTGSDGAAGAVEIRARGGRVLILRPEDARYDGMPRAVMRQAGADATLSISGLANYLNCLSRGDVPQTPSLEPDQQLQQLLEMVFASTRVNFSIYKEATLRRQVERRMSSLNLPDIPAYSQYIQHNPDELHLLKNSFLISVTSFFRDQESFLALRQILAKLVEKTSPQRGIRIWVPGCASGEEAYSVALLLAELIGSRMREIPVRIFATDIDEQAVALARTGLYPEAALENVDAAMRSRYFEFEGKQWRIAKQIRDMCVFAVHDVMRDPPFMRVDLISCRNLLIYIKPEGQDELFAKFHQALNPEGYLLLGKSESNTLAARLFSAVDGKNRLYQRQRGLSPVRPRLSVLPPMVSAAPPGRLPLAAGGNDPVRDLLLRQYAPPSVLINGNHEPLQFFGNVRRYLQLPEENERFSLLALCPAAVRHELRSLLFRAGQGPDEEYTGHVITLPNDGERIRLVVRRVCVSESSDELGLLVSFESCGRSQTENTSPPSGPEADLVSDLQYELANVREHLHAVLVEQERSGEELQSLNEELQASTEELQAANEELETSNEELQATNEELSVVNDELQEKSLELSQLNDTLSNLLNSIQMGIVVVDEQICVTRFNPLAVRVFGLLDDDIGRPLDAVPSYLHLPELRTRIQQVIASGHSLTEQVSREDSHYLMQIYPYLEHAGKHAGAVLTFSDVTEIHRTRVAREQSEERLHLIADALREVVFMHTPDWSEILYISPSFQDLWGRSTADLLADPASIFASVHEADRAQMQAHLTGEHGSHWQLEYRVIQPDGSLRWVLHQSDGVRAADGSLKAVVGSASDISERVAGELALRERLAMQLRLEQVAASTPGLICSFRLSENGQVSMPFASQAIQDIYGCSQQQVASDASCIMSLIVPEDRDAVGLSIKRSAATLKPWHAEYRIRHPQKGLRWLEGYSMPSLESDGSVIWHGYVQDITERKHSEEALRESEMRANLIFDTAPDAMLLADEEGRIVRVNPRCEVLFGYERSELEGQLIELLLPDKLRQRHVNLRQKFLQRPVNRSMAAGMDLMAQRKDGSEVPVEISLGVMQLHDKMYITAAVVDLSERKRAAAEIQRGQALLQLLTDTLPMLIAYIGPDYVYRTVNRRYYDWFGQRPELIVGQQVREVVGETVFMQLKPFIDKALAGRAVTSEIELSQRWVAINCVPDLAPDALVRGVIVAVQDISRQRADLRELRIASVAFEAHEAIFITDANSVIQRANRAFCEMTGYSAEEVIGRTPAILHSGAHGREFYQALWHDLKQNGCWQGEIIDRRKNGEPFPAWANITAVQDEQGAVTNYVAMLEDISSRKMAEEKIRNLAFFDSLTQLPNRRLLLDRLQQALAGSERSGQYGALLFIDLDNFKMLNDTHGHDLGDRLLVEVAMRLGKSVRPGDTVARLGGDEFIVMLEDLGGHATDAAIIVEDVAAKILGKLNRPFRLGVVEHMSTPSIGVALFKGEAESTEELLKRADMAMYQSKAAGRNTLRFFDPAMQAEIEARSTMESTINQALMRSEFHLYYQPQVDARGQLVGAEALVRWLHPQRGVLSPAHFIAHAEESNLIVVMGRQLLEQACRQLVLWQDDPLLSRLTLAVNISARQFHQAHFANDVSRVLLASGANPARLKLELTESMLLQDVDDTVAKMSTLQALGVNFSLDDFGTGYSSLAYLKRFPFDQMKIDQSFVRDLLTDADAATIVRAIIALGKSLRLRVVAEGIETIEQWHWLVAEGCDEGQGYLFGRPQPSGDFVANTQGWRPLSGVPA